jgi:polyribonucleotide nucleotidyltransferase
MSANDNENVEVRIDVGVLKTQVSTLSILCQKMDTVIEKIVNQQEKYNLQIYKEMETRRAEKNAEMKEVHDRIDTIIDKVQITELRIKEEIKELKLEIERNNRKEQEAIEKLNQWKWTVGGALLILSWLISHLDSDIISKLIN